MTGALSEVEAEPVTNDSLEEIKQQQKRSSLLLSLQMFKGLNLFHNEHTAHLSINESRTQITNSE